MKNLLSVIFVFVSLTVSAQSNLKSQVEYCKYEVDRLEKEVAKLKGLLEVQNDEIVELKSMIIGKNREIEEKDKEIETLNENSYYFLKLASKLEDAGDYRNAMETYKLLIQCYPRSIETISSRLKVKEMTSKLIEERKAAQEQEKKKK